MNVADFLLALLEEEPWRHDAACRGMGPSLFFPQRGESHNPAKDVCSSCTVALDCLTHAELSGEEYGIWGGKVRPRSSAMKPNLEPRMVSQPPDTLTADSSPASETEDGHEAEIIERDFRARVRGVPRTLESRVPGEGAAAFG